MYSMSYMRIVGIPRRAAVCRACQDPVRPLRSILLHHLPRSEPLVCCSQTLDIPYLFLSTVYFLQYQNAQWSLRGPANWLKAVLPVRSDDPSASCFLFPDHSSQSGSHLFGTEHSTWSIYYCMYEYCRIICNTAASSNVGRGHH